MSWAQMKALARRAVHTAFCVSASYQPPDPDAEPVALKVRWHTKQHLVGQLDSGGYAEMVEGITKIVFDKDELLQKEVTLERLGVVTLLPLEYLDRNGQAPVFILELEDEDTGPVGDTWQVTRSI